MTGIPSAALDGRICIVGITGSGKSTTAKGGVERLLADGRRVCVVDLLDAWWGLRLARDGRTPAYPVAIFGGQHGDLPLTEHAGALIGQAVAQSDGSCIVSLSELDGDAARRRFALAFFDALHKTNRAPLHLVIDECDFYSPQVPVKEGPGPLLLNRIKEIAARGRMRGFRVWPITQRPAKLHKDVLSQADTLVAMQLTSSQDRAALRAWIGDQGDENVGARMLQQLPSLKRGQGVLWSPRIGILDTVNFPLPATYDSSRTPEHGEKATSVELKPIDLGALREKMGKVEAEAKANDPRELRAEIARLRAELARKPAAAVDDAAIYAARQEGYREGFAAMAHHERDALERLREAGRKIGEAYAAFARGVEEGIAQAIKAAANIQPPPTKAPGVVHRQTPFVAQPAASAAPPRQPVAPSAGLTGPEQRILDAQMQDLQATVGEALLPVMAGFTTMLNQLVQAVLPPVSTAPPMAPTPAPTAVFCPCADMPAQPPRPSMAATTAAFSDTLCKVFMELPPHKLRV